jgi:hypothetical protein
VTFRAEGAVPDLRDVLTGLDHAVEGYSIKEDGIEAMPTNVVQEGDPTATYYYRPSKPPENGYPEPDEHGIYRLPVERSWTVTYTPSGGALGKSFRLPRLREGVAATLESRYYSDYDLVPATGSTIPIQRRSLWRYAILSGGGLVVILAAFMVYRRRRTDAGGDVSGVALPEHVTPLTALVALRRIAAQNGDHLSAQRRSELEREIASIEMKYFGPGENPEPNSDLSDALRRWAGSAAEETEAGV